MPEISLSYKVPDYGKMDTMPAPVGGKSNKTPTKDDYPTLSIPGNLALAQSLRAGQEFTATVKFRVSEVAIRDKDRGDVEDDDDDRPCDVYGGTRVELQAQSMNIQGVAIKEGSQEADGATAIKNYFGKKAKAANSEGDEQD